MFLKLSLIDIPHLVPMIQAQQGSLSYFCQENEMPTTCSFNGPLKVFEDARDLVIHELASDVISDKISYLMKNNKWIEDGDVYFELVGNASNLFPDISFICSKVYMYDNGLIFNAIYFEGTIYVTIQDSDGEQPLLDINFPDIRLDHNGSILSLYDNPASPWMKLSIGHFTNSRFDSTDHEIGRTHSNYRSMKSEPTDERRCLLNEKYAILPENENDQSMRSISSSDEDNRLLGAVASAIDIIDDAMIDICNTFNCAMVHIDSDDKFCMMTDKKNVINSEFDRATKLTILENKTQNGDNDSPNKTCVTETKDYSR